MQIVFGADYKCLGQREELVGVLASFGGVVDVVALEPKLVDYVEVAQEVAGRVAGDPLQVVGVLVCGTGIGISITANKFREVHAARCLCEQDAVDARTINNANVLCLSAGTPVEMNVKIVRTFCGTVFPGDEKRAARLRKLAAIERGNFGGAEKAAGPTIERALAAARETRRLEIGVNILERTGEVFGEVFPGKRAGIVADINTFGVAGKRVQEAFGGVGRGAIEPLIFSDADLYAEYRFVERVQEWLGMHDAVPVAVGAGTINDLVKLAAHRRGREYMCVATAASMDGYTAFGSSITRDGVKQTFDCPAPAAVMADLEVIGKAPVMLNAAGYADLLAKITAGADWIVADALGVERIDRTAWELVQTPLRDALADAAGVRGGKMEAVRRLTEGLMMGGFAMQWTKSSRPASGAEHQFSHLWDMQHHVQADGRAPSHGFKVAIGTLAVASLYEHLLTLPLEKLDVGRAVGAWAGREKVEAEITRYLGAGELAERSRIEMKAKAVTAGELGEQLTVLKAKWPELSRRLRGQLPAMGELKRMLRAAGAPTHPGEIGITVERLRESFRQAYYIRRRFTVLDLVMRADLLDSCLEVMFGAGGEWGG